MKLFIIIGEYQILFVSEVNAALTAWDIIITAGFEKIVGKGGNAFPINAGNTHFLIFLPHFLPYQTQNLKYIQFGPVIN